MTTPTESIDVAYVAQLARIDLTDEETRLFQGQLAHILDYFHQINELDVSEVEPMAHAVPVNNVFREDRVRPGLDHEEVMSLAPGLREEQFEVPRIIE